MASQLNQSSSKITWGQKLSPRYYFLYLGIILGWILVQLLPHIFLIKLGRFLGYLGFYFSARRRKIAKINISNCFPDKDQQAQLKLLKRCFAMMGQGFFETLIAWWMPIFRLKKIKFFLDEDADFLKYKPQGILLCGAHLSSMELVGCLFALRYGKFSLVYQKHKDPIVNQIINRGRSRYTRALIDRREIKKMMKVLKNKECLWIAPDQDLGRRVSVFVDFFKTPCATSRIISVLLSAHSNSNSNSNDSELNMGVQCFFAFSYQDNLGTYHGTMGLQKKLPSGDSVFDASLYNQALEKIVDQYPEQYLWLHRRFKTRPLESEPYFYADRSFDSN